MRRLLTFLAFALTSAAAVPAQGPTADPALAARVKELYTKREVRIRVRDGVQLFTSVYVPRDTTRRYPVLMSRTPYSVSPYGADYKAALGPSGNRKWVEDGYIFVYQDVRGRNFSEGVFRDMTPILEKHDAPTDVDEGTDAYDSIDWLVKNLPTNGKVGGRSRNRPPWCRTRQTRSGSRCGPFTTRSGVAIASWCRCRAHGSHISTAIRSDSCRTPSRPYLRQHNTGTHLAGNLQLSLVDESYQPGSFAVATMRWYCIYIPTRQRMIIPNAAR